MLLLYECRTTNRWFLLPLPFKLRVSVQTLRALNGGTQNKLDVKTLRVSLKIPALATILEVPE
jgi:hypothetical protein